MRLLNIKAENKNKTLLEAYHKTDKYVCLLFMEQILQKLNNIIDEKTFESNCKKLKCSLVEDYLNVPYPAITACYRRFHDVFEIQYSKAFEGSFKVCTRENVEDFVNDFWLAFIHEDTHKQQNANIPTDVKIKLQQKYVQVFFDDPSNLELEQNRSYYNQVEEADAFGREVAQRLIVDYKIFGWDEIQSTGMKSKTDKIFEALKNGVFERDEYIMNLYRIYKDPRISKEATQHFFRALYDYLEEHETQEVKNEIV